MDRYSVKRPARKIWLEKKIRALPFFCHLSDDSSAALANTGRAIPFKPRDIILQKSAVHLNTVFIVDSGSVSLSTGKVLCAGDYFANIPSIPFLAMPAWVKVEALTLGVCWAVSLSAIDASRLIFEPLSHLRLRCKSFFFEQVGVTLSDVQCDHLLFEISVIRRFDSSKEIVATEGTPCMSVFVVLSGSLREETIDFERQKRYNRDFGSNDFFGERSLLPEDENEWQFSVMTTSSCLLLEIPGEACRHAILQKSDGQQEFEDIEVSFTDSGDPAAAAASFFLNATQHIVDSWTLAASSPSSLRHIRSPPIPPMPEARKSFQTRIFVWGSNSHGQAIYCLVMFPFC